MACKWQFGSRARDFLYSAAKVTAYLAGRGNHPICHHCDKPVLETDNWHRVHVGTPRWLGGKSVGVGHDVCNLLDNNKVVTPQRSKTLRIRAKHLGVKGPGLGRHPMPCGRASTMRKSMGGKVVARISVADAHAAFMRKRYPFLQGERDARTLQVVEAPKLQPQELFLQIGNKRYQVASIAEAVTKHNMARDACEHGASKFPRVTIVSANGTHLYGISYNGRVWDGDKPLDGLTGDQWVAGATTGKAA